ncbi:phage recombination protein Bet [Massilia sp. CCM 8734]|uniref:phage recombination protein Bet n=1 Tax=Massilia sp. CCM 8734 TaxID=2609283 RepID=UPI001421A985|nr:phage recombination protein Bet [Massilia sp. CCM 8734]NHZ94626.1 phage recombination protein Bet [Massilia sp. CCM 8734]
MSNALVVKQVSQLAAQFSIPDSDDLTTVLKATAFKGQVSDAQMSALLIVASQYGLNPWTKEIYAFPDQNNGIVPVVGVDGWSRIINSHPQFDGMDFMQDEESCTCIIHRKDRSHPVKVTEWLSECKRPVKPWQSHPKRMLRHKALIQCARLAFGYVGIYDLDEAERIVESPMQQAKARPADIVVESEATRTPASAELVARIEAEADRGYTAFSEAWAKLTKDERTSFTSEQIQSFKARTDKVIEVEE